MDRTTLLIPVVSVVITALVGGLASGVGAQPSPDVDVRPSPDVDVRRCENAASDVPGFGGAYIAEREADGTVVLHVLMTEADAAATETALMALSKRCPEYGDVVLHDASYSYAQLSEWERLAWTLPVVTLTGIDTRANRLTVAVADLDSDGGRVRDALAQRGVPADAVSLIEMSAPQTSPIIDRTKSVWLAGASGVIVLLTAIVAVVWLGRRRRPGHTGGGGKG